MATAKKNEYGSMGKNDLMWKICCLVTCSKCARVWSKKYISCKLIFSALIQMVNISKGTFLAWSKLMLLDVQECQLTHYVGISPLTKQQYRNIWGKRAGVQMSCCMIIAKLSQECFIPNSEPIRTSVFIHRQLYWPGPRSLKIVKNFGQVEPLFKFGQI